MDHDLQTGDMPVDIDGPHGVAVSPDDLYAFVTVEGVGSEPGTVEITDLKTLQMSRRLMWEKKQPAWISTRPNHRNEMA